MYAILQLGYFILLSFYWKIMLINCFMFKLYLQYSLQRLEHFLITQLGYSFLNIQCPKIRYWWLKHKTVLKPQYLKTPKVTTQHLTTQNLATQYLKGTVSRDLRPFFGYKTFTWAPYKQSKSVSRNFFVFANIFAKNAVCV